MFYEVKVKVEFDAGNGKVKNKTESYLVDAMSVTEAEVRVVEYFKGSVIPFEVKGAQVSRIIDVIKSSK
jgi:hypothetical protein